MLKQNWCLMKLEYSKLIERDRHDQACSFLVLCVLPHLTAPNLRLRLLIVLLLMYIFQRVQILDLRKA